MYAIIADGSHQYRVEEGEVLEVQKRVGLDPNAETVEFDRVLLIGDGEDGPRIGQPVVEGAKVTASVMGEFRAGKITIQKRRRRKTYRLKQGHRQTHLRVKIEKIEA